MMSEEEAWKIFSTIDTHCLLSVASYYELRPTLNPTIQEKLHRQLNERDQLGSRVTLNQIGRCFSDHNLLKTDDQSRHFRYHSVKQSIMDMNDPDCYYRQLVELDGMTEDEIYDEFHRDPAEKSYLLSVIVSDKFYDIVKTNLIRYAKLILENEVPGNWHMKVITHANKPFNLLNIFMTNSQVMQIVNLGFDLTCMLTTANEEHSWKKSHMGELNDIQLDRINNQLSRQIYIWQPQNIRDVYRQQLVDLNDQDVTPVLNKLEQIVQNIVKQAKRNGNVDFYQRYDTSIDQLDLDNLLVYRISDDQKLQSETFALNQLNMKERHAELQPLINKLLHQMNE